MEDRKRTKDETLALYRKLLANANQLIRKLREENREKDRIIAKLKKGQQLAQEEVVVAGVQGGERNLLDLVPEEVWGLIFDRLDNWQDLKSCYDTCPLFRQVLEESKNQWLFPGVLPLLVDHLDKGAKLKCRQICKGWRDLVDKEALVGGTYYLPFSGPDDPQRTKLEETKTLGIKDPFPLRHVTIYGCHPDNNIEEEWEEIEEDENEAGLARVQSFVEDAKEFFRNFGPDVQHLTLNVYNCSVRESQLWDVLLFGLTHCTNLKSLTVSGFSTLKYFVLEPLNLEEINGFMPAGFGVSSSLKSLKVDTLPGFRQLQDFILERCSSQIKRIQVEEWSPQLMAELPWDSLEELDLSDARPVFSDESVLASLVQTTAPNLTKLAFQIESHTEDTLRQLLLVASKFPKLVYLQIENLSGFPREAVNSVPEGLVASPSLKTLEFSMFTKYGGVKDLCFDALLYFPSVEVLNLRIFKNAGKPSEETMAKHSLLELSGAWLTEEKIYQSNVWKLMPCLRTIALKEGKRHPFFDYSYFIQEQSKFQPVFTRKKYDEFCKKIKN